MGTDICAHTSVPPINLKATGQTVVGHLPAAVSKTGGARVGAGVADKPLPFRFFQEIAKAESYAGLSVFGKHHQFQS